MPGGAFQGEMCAARPQNGGFETGLAVCAGEARSESPAPNRAASPATPGKHRRRRASAFAISPTGGGESLNPLIDSLYLY